MASSSRSVRGLTLDSFVRQLSFSMRQKLAFLLNPHRMWEKLAAEIPINPKDLFRDQMNSFEPRYVTQNIECFNATGNPVKALLEDWEIQNCQLKHLVKALQNADLLKAAEYVMEECQSTLEEMTNSLDTVSASEEVGENVLSLESGGNVGASLNDGAPREFENLQLQDDMPKLKNIQQMPEISFEKLRGITANFNSQMLSQGGRLLGSGGFGDVFLGVFWSEDLMEKHKVAVKRLREQSEESLKQFYIEFETLCTYKHENLVTLLGYSRDGAYPCLVYEYVFNGSLECRLACEDNSPPLSVPVRLEIARGTAKAIEFLHGEDVTHRDIKSANILLDSEFKPKVSDFATARTLPNSEDMKTQILHTILILGTPPYLAPEARHFIIHHGLDIFSFGVVILELLTGLPAFDSTRKIEDLKIYVQEFCAVPDDDADEDEDDEDESGTISDLLDKKPGVVWNPMLVEELYTLSLQCLEHSMKKRKKISYVVRKLDSMSADCEGDNIQR